MATRKPLTAIRDAVCDCINDHLQELLDECELPFLVGPEQPLGKRTTRAICAYNPNYDLCKDNETRIHIYGAGRNLLLDDSIANCRGKVKRIQNITTEYQVVVEVLAKLNGCDDEIGDIAPIGIINELEDLSEAIDELLFCKRELETPFGTAYQRDTDPVHIPWDQRNLSERSLWLTQTVHSYRLQRCCPDAVVQIT